MAENKKQYLTEEFIAKIDKFNLRARLIVEGFITGLHKSPYHGFSIEFSDHRQYNPGDPIKNVDWKIYGKTNRYYIKRYEEETNLKCHIIVEVSHYCRPQRLYGLLIDKFFQVGIHQGSGISSFLFNDLTTGCCGINYIHR